MLVALSNIMMSSAGPPASTISTPGAKSALRSSKNEANKLAKSREKIQQLGFWDPEVSTPSHDNIVLWAYDNTETILRLVMPDAFDHAWLQDEVLRSRHEREERFLQMARKYVDSNPRPNPRARKKTLEYVLTTQTGYQGKLEKIVGYADLLIDVEFPCVSINESEDGVHLVWRHGRDLPANQASVLVEAKSVLPSIGELMRQIQLYRTAHSGPVVVVSPDDQYAQILGEQGVFFIQSPKG